MVRFANERPSMKDEIHRKLKRMVIYDDYYNEILHNNPYNMNDIVYKILDDNERLLIDSYYYKRMKLADIATMINKSPAFIYKEHDRILDSICVKIINKTIGVKECFNISYLKLPESIRRRLMFMGYGTIEKLAKLNQDDLYQIDRFGMTKINAIIKALDDAGIQHNLKKVRYRGEGR